MDTLLLKRCWILVSSMKNMDCVADMLECLCSVDGAEWNQETRGRYFRNLVQRRVTAPELNHLSEEQRNLLKSGNATEEQIKELVDNIYPDGRYPVHAYMQPLLKLGLVKIDFEDHKKLIITERGHQLLEGKITDEEMMIQALTDWKYPRTREDVYDPEWKGYNIRPMMATIAVIEQVNQRDERNGMEPNGITFDEFMVYLMTMYSCGQINDRVRTLEWLHFIEKKIGKSAHDQKMQEDSGKIMQEFAPIKSESVKSYRYGIFNALEKTGLFVIDYPNKRINLNKEKETIYHQLLEKHGCKAY